MIASAVADTHAAIWYVASDSRLSSSAKEFIDSATAKGDKIGLSSISLIEIVYLIEKGRIPAETFTRLANVLNDPLGAFAEIPVSLAIARTLSRVNSLEIPDMPDRIIAATALDLGVPLVSRDGRIRISSIQTIW
jgi:PIN domain nuclease of toxin-antitoxin system